MVYLLLATSYKEHMYNSTGTQSAVSLKVDQKHINQFAMDRYRATLDHKKMLNNKIVNYERERRRVEERIHEIWSKKEEILKGKGKPLFQSKKKWLLIKQSEISSLEDEISKEEEKKKGYLKKIEQIEEELKLVKYNSYEENNEEFEVLKYAFDTFKLSCNIDGIPSIKKSSISSCQYDQDLKDIQYNEKPYGLLLGNYRFYIFPNGIWVFKNDSKLSGIFKPCALRCNYETSEQTDYGWGNKLVYDDTTVMP